MLAVVFALVMRSCVLEPVRTSDDSMAPQVIQGDVVLVSKVRYGIRVPGSGAMLLEWSAPKKGDLVVAVSVSDPPVNLLRRILGLPGEKITLEDGKVVEVPKGQYFLGAEQKENVMDSRQFGPVSRRAIIGKASYIWIPGNQSSSPKGGTGVESEKSARRFLQPLL